LGLFYTFAISRIIKYSFIPQRLALITRFCITQFLVISSVKCYRIARIDSTFSWQLAHLYCKQNNWRFVELTGDGNEAEAPDDTPDPANKEQDWGYELEHGHPDVDEQQTGEVDVVSLRTWAACQTHAGHKCSYKFILRGRKFRQT